MDVWEIHPALVHFPIAFLLGGVLLDLYAWRRRDEPARAATALLLAGVATGVPAALAGVLAFYTVPSSHTEEAHRLVLWHIGFASAMLILFTVVAVVRRRRRHAPPTPLVRALGLAAAVALLVAAALGGRIVYHGGMGVDPGVGAPHLRGHTHGAGRPSEEGGNTPHQERGPSDGRGRGQHGH